MRKLGAISRKDSDDFIKDGDVIVVDASGKNLGNAYIGCGYDLINDFCFSSDKVKARVFIPRNNKVILEGSGKSDDVDFYTVFDGTKASQSIAAAMKINVSYGIFKGEAKAAYNEDKSSEHSYAYSCASYIYQKGTERYDRSSVSDVLEDGALTTAFEKAINDYSVSPERIVLDYGTHVIANGVVRGARLNFYLKTLHDSSMDKKKLETAINISFGKAFGAKANVDIEEKYQRVVNETTCKFYQAGGDAGSQTMSLTTNLEGFQKTCEIWKDSLNNEDNAKEIARVGTLLPIWEFARDPARQAQLKNYMLNGKETGILEKAPIIVGDYHIGEIQDAVVSKELFDKLREYIKGVNPNQKIKSNTTVFFPSSIDRDTDIETAIRKDFPDIDNGEVTIPASEVTKYFRKIHIVPLHRDGDGDDEGQDVLSLPYEVYVNEYEGGTKGEIWNGWVGTQLKEKVKGC